MGLLSFLFGTKEKDANKEQGSYAQQQSREARLADNQKNYLHDKHCKQLLQTLTDPVCAFAKKHRVKVSRNEVIEDVTRAVNTVPQVLVERFFDGSCTYKELSIPTRIRLRRNNAVFDLKQILLEITDKHAVPMRMRGSIWFEVNRCLEKEMFSC